MGRKSELPVVQREEAVLSLLRKEEPMAALSRRYQVSEQTLYRWRDEFLAGGRARLGKGELLAIARHPTFLLIVGGMFLINIAQPFAASQLKLVVLAKGMPDNVGTWMVSLYAMGVMIGRVIFGLALDRIAANVVAVCALSLPAFGFLILASDLATIGPVAGGILLIGVAQGAEGDIGGYLVSRHFDLKNYSLTFSFVKSALDAGGAFGALLLSYSLSTTDGSFVPFLLICAATTVAGAVLFFLTGRDRIARQPGDAIAPETI